MSFEKEDLDTLDPDHGTLPVPEQIEFLSQAYLGCLDLGLTEAATHALEQLTAIGRRELQLLTT